MSKVQVRPWRSEPGNSCHSWERQQERVCVRLRWPGGQSSESMSLVSNVFIFGLLPNSGLGKHSPLAHFVTAACSPAANTMTRVLQTDYVGSVQVCMCECSDLAKEKKKTCNLKIWVPNRGTSLIFMIAPSIRCNLSYLQCEERVVFLSLFGSQMRPLICFSSRALVHLRAHCLFLWEDWPRLTRLHVCSNRGHASSPHALLRTLFPQVFVFLSASSIDPGLDLTSKSRIWQLWDKRYLLWYLAKRVVFPIMSVVLFHFFFKCV